MKIKTKLLIEYLEFYELKPPTRVNLIPETFSPETVLFWGIFTKEP